MIKDLKKYIRSIPDFPKKGIVFRDITTLIKEKAVFKYAIDELAKRYRDKKVDYIVSVESRGFIFGAALAYVIGCGVVPVRKKGKLPYDTHSVTYDLEYGRDTLEIHKDAFQEKKRILVLDDLLATGGTTRAVIDLIKKLGGEIVEVAFVIELEFLKGCGKIKDVPVFSLVKYDSE
ncbi:MAG: adenine phosphoribosyltransferase [Candidatus Omnitrophica bacterium]|nr:adenine phosphoribosyltransferase [Candidatus Omnitrophota bacterium]